MSENSRTKRGFIAVWSTPPGYAPTRGAYVAVLAAMAYPEVEVTAADIDELAGLLKAAGFKDDNPADYTRYGSARELYHFHVDNTSAY